MRLFELEGQYASEIADAAVNIIYTASAEGQDSISTQDMISDLAADGYMTNVKDLIELLQDNPIIVSISKDSIDIDTGINDSGKEEFADKNQADKNKNIVSKMARKQISKDI